MSGVLRLGNTGAGTGRSTVQASASNDQTFLLPEAGGTLLTSNYSVPGGTITFNGSDINITNGDLNVNSGTLFVDESTGNVQVGNTVLVDTSTNKVGISTTTIEAKVHIAESNTNPISTLSTDINRILLEDTSGLSSAGAGSAIDFAGIYGGLGRIAISKGNSATSGTTRDNGTFSLFLNQNLGQDTYAAFQEVLHIDSSGSNQGLVYSFRGGEQLRVDSTGNLLVNLSTARTQFFNGANVPVRLQVEGSDSFEAAGAITRNDNSSDAPSLILAKSRDTAYQVLQYTDGSTADDRIGRISFQGADSTKFIYGAQIEAYTDGTPGLNDMPARLVFSTTDPGSNQASEKMRISSTGAIDLYGGVSNFDNTKKPRGLYSKSADNGAVIFQKGNRCADAYSFFFNQPSSGNQAVFDLLKITGWQSSNSRFFAIVNWMFVNPVGYAGNNPRGAGYTDAFARYNNASLTIGTTVITVPLVGGAAASNLQWTIDSSNDLILQYVANAGSATQMAYAGHKVRVEWVSKDGIYVRYAVGNG